MSRQIVTIEDSCPCGAEFSIDGPDQAFGASYQHRSWLISHRVCREAVAAALTPEPEMQAGEHRD